MSEQMQIFVLGAFIIAMGGLCTAVATMAWHKFQQVDSIKDAYEKDRVNYEHRHTMTEQQLINLRESLDNLATVTEKRFVVFGAKAMHSPDDHLGADPELERFATLYVQHDCDMPNVEGSDWVYWRKFFFQLAHKPQATINERLMAMTFRELCEHKLLKYGLLAETIRKQQLE